MEGGTVGVAVAKLVWAPFCFRLLRRNSARSWLTERSFCSGLVRDEEDKVSDGGATEGGFEYLLLCLFLGITVEDGEDLSRLFAKREDRK